MTNGNITKFVKKFCLTAPRTAFIMQFFVAFATICLIDPVVCGRASDAHEISLGKLELQPFVSAKETWTDNVFTTSSNEQRDRVETAMPGFKAVFPFRMHAVEINYYAVLTRYERFPDEKTNDQAGNALLALKSGSELTLKFDNAFIKSHEPRGSSTTGFIEKYANTAKTVSLAYRLADRSKIEIEYSKKSWKFRTSTFRDRREDAASAYFYYRFLPKTSAFVEYDRKTVDFSEITTTLDNDVVNALLGLNWEMTSRSKGTVKVGRSRKDFLDSVQNDHGGWMSSVDVSHSFTRDTSIILSGQRMINEANRIGTRFFTTTMSYAEISHRFGHRLTSGIHGSYATDVFSDVVAPEPYRREDKTLSCGGGMKYSFRDSWEVGADYTYRSRNSNLDANDYRERQYSLLLSVML